MDDHAAFYVGEGDPVARCTAGTAAVHAKGRPDTSNVEPPVYA
ncbi:MULTISPECIES: hypothetical protein [unclassified Sphingomonas]|nr:MULTISPECIES: hypothetical protein [unclassified Sphingomonas]